MRKPSDPAFRWTAVPLIAALLAIVFGGAVFYKFQENRQRRQVEASLAAIARLKADQIAAWRAERIGDARVIMDRQTLINDINDYFTRPEEAGERAIKRRLETLKTSYRYANILLVDPDGRVRLSLNGHDVIDHTGFTDALTASLRDHKPVFTDLHTEKNDPAPHISVIAPLFSEDEPLRPVGAAVLISNAMDFLFPLIQSWPVPSRSSETLLVRRDGDHVLFLNDLRHMPDTALRLRIPVSRADLPAAMAVLGRQGVVAGKDYRGVEVLSVVLPVPDSPWFIVSKIDADEAFTEWRFRSSLILILILAGIGIITILGIAFWQREKKRHYRMLLQSETARRADAERYRTTLRSIGDAVIVTDADGRVMMMNFVAETLTGWNEGDARGRPLEEIFRIFNEATGATVESPAARVLREGVVVGLANHTILISRDGSRRPIADSGAPVRDDSGAIAGVVLVFRDQTKERAAQKALVESEDKFKYVFDHSAVAKSVTLVSGEINVNRAFCEMLGYTREELGKKKWQDITHPEDIPPTQEKLSPLLSGEKASGRFVKRYVRKDGGIVWGDVSTSLRLDEEGRPLYFMTTVVDVTEQKRAEEALRESEAYIRTILDNLPIGIAVNRVFPKIEFSYMNDNFLKYYRTTREALAEPDGFWEAVYHDPLFREKIKNTVLESCAGGDPERMHWSDVPLIRQGGETTFIEAMNVPIPGKDYMVSVVWDVTARKQAETEKEKLTAQLVQAQKMESVGRLAGGVAHDFNNMLNVILGHAELALEKVGPKDPLHEDLTEIFDAGRRSAEITKQLLAFARRQIIVPRAVYLNDTVEKMLKMLRRLIGEDIDLAWKPGAGLWPVLIDPVQIDQILANLCVNARDAISGVGKITLETGAICIDEAYCADHLEFIPGEFVVLSVSDSGHGMDKDTLDHIFEPFFTTKDVSQGTGLGLATVYGIARQNNGFINVYSEPGQGATFRIYLPRYLGEVDATEAPDAAAVPAGRGETVLVVEDEAAILTLTRKMLAGLGYAVLTAPGPATALKLAEKHPGAINLLITDVVMPGMNGRDLAEKLKARYPHLRVLFMSGYTANVIAHRGILDAGMLFIQKPFNRGDLARKVREALGNDE